MKKSMWKCVIWTIACLTSVSSCISPKKVLYLSGKVDELSNDAVVQSISLAKEIINNEAEWKRFAQTT